MGPLLLGDCRRKQPAQSWSRLQPVPARCPGDILERPVRGVGPVYRTQGHRNERRKWAAQRETTSHLDDWAQSLFGILQEALRTCT